MRPVHGYLGGLAALSALLVLGCGSQDDAAAKAVARMAQNKAGFLRVVNLLDRPVAFALNDGGETNVQPDEVSGFARARPNRDAKLSFKGVGVQPVIVKVESDQTHSVYLSGDPAAPKVNIVIGDPTTSEDKNAAVVRFVSLAGAATELVAEGPTNFAESLGPASGDPIGGKATTLRPGSYTFHAKQAGSAVATVSQTVEAGQAISVIVYNDAEGKAVLVVKVNNPPMKVEQVGSSAAG